MRSDTGSTISGLKITAAALTGLLGLGLVSCTPPHPRHHDEATPQAISTLDCPSEQDELKLQSKAADGKSCAYATGAGDQVTLQLVALTDGDVKTALGPLETQLQSELPPAPPTGTSSGGSKDWGAGNDKDRVDLDLPGLHIHSRGDGRADVDTAGVHVSAQDGPKGGGDGEAHVAVADGSHGGVTVDAHDGRAQIRVTDKGDGVRLAYLLESDKPGPNGYRLAGYEARGPSDGPIVVAKILAKSHDGDELRHSVRRLLDANVGN
jgi:hypothetical protein